MISGKIIISGAGCALADFLYSEISFDSPNFLKYKSKESGDGGLSIGRLVFTEELEKFAGRPYSEIIKEIIGMSCPRAFNVGGPSLVSLIHTSQLLERQDYEVKFFGVAGDDDTADKIFKIIRRTPLKIKNYTIASGFATPFTYVLSDPNYDKGSGERTFIHNIGAAKEFSTEKLNSDFFNSHIVCFGGTALVPSLHEDLSQILQIAKYKSCITVVNTVFDFQNERKAPGKPWPMVNKIEEYYFIDLLIMDCEEAIRISGKSNIDDSALFFASTKVSSFIITNGANDLVVWSSGRLFEKTKIIKLPVSQKISNELKANPSKKGDTTGCGDNFAGGVIASLAWQLKDCEKGNLSFIEAISWGVASGGYSCFTIGGTHLEQFTGEKRERIRSIQQDYLSQIKAL